MSVPTAPREEPAGTCSCNGSPGNWGFHPRKGYFEGIGNVLLSISAIASIPTCGLAYVMGGPLCFTLIGCILVAQELEEEKKMVGMPVGAVPAYGAIPQQPIPAAQMKV